MVTTHGFPHAEHMQWNRGNECGSVGRGRKMSGRKERTEEGRELSKDTHIINEKREKEESNGQGLGFFLFCPFSSCNWVQSHAHLFGKWTPILASSSSSPSSPHFSLSGIIMMMMGVYFVQFHLHHFTCLLKYWLGWTLSMLYRLPTILFKKKKKKEEIKYIHTH